MKAMLRLTKNFVLAMEIQIKKLVFCAVVAANFYCKVHGYCMPGKGKRIMQFSMQFPVVVFERFHAH